MLVRVMQWKRARLASQMDWQSFWVVCVCLCVFAAKAQLYTTCAMSGHSTQRRAHNGNRQRTFDATIR